MRKLIYFSFKGALIVFAAISAVHVSAQDARIQFELLKGMETTARDVVEAPVEQV